MANLNEFKKELAKMFDTKATLLELEEPEGGQKPETVGCVTLAVAGTVSVVTALAYLSIAATRGQVVNVIIAAAVFIASCTAITAALWALRRRGVLRLKEQDSVDAQPTLRVICDLCVSQLNLRVGRNAPPTKVIQKAAAELGISSEAPDGSTKQLVALAHECYAQLTLEHGHAEPHGSGDTSWPSHLRSHFSHLSAMGRVTAFFPAGEGASPRPDYTSLPMRVPMDPVRPQQIGASIEDLPKPGFSTPLAISLPPMGGASSSLDEWIANNKLKEFGENIKCFVKHVSELAAMEDDELDILISECEVSKLGAHRLRKAIAALGANVSFNTPASSPSKEHHA